ncbi:MAG: chitinase, partial [Mucilaginibacter sp.]|nr:chitinase [Mucilaginibacter sp.]
MRIFGLFIALICLLFQKDYAQKPVVITYAGGYRGNLIDARKIEAGKLTHLLYAFADLKNKKAYLHYPETDRINLNRLVRLRQGYPDLKVLLSVGGIGWSRNFSTMALTTNGRQSFAQSCVQLVKDFDLDGIDIDWEFPGYPGEGGNIYRSEDQQNYTRLFKELRDQFDLLQQNTGKHILITVAVDGWAPHFLP